MTSPVLRFAIRETGALEVISPWFPFIAVGRDLLARADGRRLAVQGDELTIRCTNGGATYALEPVDARGVRAGRLIRSWT